MDRRARQHLLCGVAGLMLLVFSSFHLDPSSFPSERTLTAKPGKRQSTAVAQMGFQSRFQDLSLRADSGAFPERAARLRPGLAEDPEGRSDWFTFQRAYPSDSITSDARRQAWESQAEFQISGHVSAQASPTWRSIGPSPTVSPWYDFWGLTSGRINSVAVSPVNSRLVLIGSSTGGIWRSTDGGEGFVPVSDDQIDLAVGSIAFSKSNPSIVYAGMGDTKAGYLGSGVLKSTDEGRTWVRVSNNSLPSPGSVAKLEIDAANPNRLYVAQYSIVSGDKVTSGGVYRSTDGGVNWSRALAGAPRDVVIDPGDSRKIYVGLSRIDKDTDPPFGVYRSTDSGSTWANLLTAQYELNRRRDVRLAISSDDQKIYAYFGGFIGTNLDAHLKASTDAGATWSDCSLAGVDLAQFGYNTFLFADPQNAPTLYLGSRDLFKSTDGGDSWTNMTGNFYDGSEGFAYAPGGSKTHPDQHALAFSPSGPNEFYVGNDGGVSKTTDGGNTFRSLNATLTLTQFIGIVLHPLNPAISYGGTQDNGTQLRSANSSTWYEIVTGDGGHAVINPQDPSMVFMTYVRGDIYVFINDGHTTAGQITYNGTFGEFATPRIAFYPPFVGNRVDATLYFGTWRLFVSTDLGYSWFAPAGFFDLTKGITNKGADVLSAIAVARSNTNVIYTGSAQGRAMVSTNSGGTWTDVTRGLPDRFITSITVDPADAATAYLTVSGFNSGHIFKTTDTGATWADISVGLPNVPANTLLIDPIVPDTIYAGTDVGVFRSTTRGASWRGFNKGMPPVVVHEFASQESGLIQVATYGRGAYEFLGNQRPVIESASFDGKKRLTISGTAFGETPRVMVNDKEKSGRINTASDTEVILSGKSKKLGLKPGDNTLQIITSDNVISNVFTIRL